MANLNLTDYKDKLIEVIPTWMESLGYDIREDSKRYYGVCPIHEGDNRNAFCMYKDSGIWHCWTCECEKKTDKSIFGFVRAILQKKQKREIQYKEIFNFVEKTFNVSASTLTDPESARRRFVRQAAVFATPELGGNFTITREQARQHLQMPCSYYINRGYSSEILDKYDVGICSLSHKPMFNRCVFPIYDEDHELVIGCSGRSLYEKCCKCQLFHSPYDECPTDNEYGQYSKWRHHGFQSSNILFNYWFAKKYIEETNCAILVEGPGDVLKLEENGIHNSVALFGISLKEGQQRILERSGALKLIILTDNDEAGREAASRIQQMCSRMYKLYFPKFDGKDIGESDEHSIEYLKQFIEVNL